MWADLRAGIRCAGTPSSLPIASAYSYPAYDPYMAYGYYGYGYADPYAAYHAAQYAAVPNGMPAAEAAKQEDEK